MDQLKISVPPKKNLRPDLSKNLNLMIEMLDVELKLWNDKTVKQGKTANSIVKCKTALEMAEDFSDKDDWKAFTVVMQRNINVDTLKACFYREKDKQNTMLNLYKNTNITIIKWMRLIRNADSE